MFRTTAAALAVLLAVALVPGPRVAAAAPVDGAVNAPVNTHVERAHGETVYAAFGDSITAGVGTSDPRTRSYPRLAGIKAVGRSSGCIAVACGQHAALRDRFTDLVGRISPRPDVVFVALGANDLHLVTDATLIDAYRSVLAQGRAVGVRVVLATIAPLNWNCVCVGLDDQRRRIDRWIRSRRLHVDFDKALRGEADGLLRADYDSGDGLPPNDAGALAMAVALLRWMLDRR